MIQILAQSKVLFFNPNNIDKKNPNENDSIAAKAEKAKIQCCKEEYTTLGYIILLTRTIITLPNHELINPLIN